MRSLCLPMHFWINFILIFGQKVTKTFGRLNNHERCNRLEQEYKMVIIICIAHERIIMLLNVLDGDAFALIVEDVLGHHVLRNDDWHYFGGTRNTLPFFLVDLSFDHLLHVRVLS